MTNELKFAPNENASRVRWTCEGTSLSIRERADFWRVMADDGDYIEMSVTSPEEAVAASVKAEEFCRIHGENERNSRLISLCIEEMANNTVKHGFSADKKEHSIDIRLLFKNHKRLIRMRDNCIGFDPVDYMKLHEADDPAAHIGIRMVMKMVKNANYVNTLGLNNLTLEL